MKKLHLTASTDDLRPAMNYIQVKNGYCYSTDAHVLVKVPVKEVFGDIFSNEDEAYILAKDWKTAKVYAGVHFRKENNLIKVLDKKYNQIGMLEYLTADQFNNSLRGRFPDCEAVLYKPDAVPAAIDAIGLDPVKLDSACKAISNSGIAYKLEFYGQNRAVKITYHDSEAVGIVMPCILN